MDETYSATVNIVSGILTVSREDGPVTLSIPIGEIGVVNASESRVEIAHRSGRVYRILMDSEHHAEQVTDSVHRARIRRGGPWELWRGMTVDAAFGFIRVFDRKANIIDSICIDAIRRVQTMLHDPDEDYWEVCLRSDKGAGQVAFCVFHGATRAHEFANAVHKLCAYHPVTTREQDDA